MAKGQGYIGLKIAFKIPEIYMPYLELLDNQSVGHAIREAMRTAGRPATNALKSLLQLDLIPSEQSTGATERAVDMKYGRNKRDPRRFYVIVGINKKHIELHTKDVPEGQITRLRRGRKQRGAGLYAIQTRQLKNKTYRSKQVFSRYRDQRRIAKLNGKVIKRFPKKYFHLIDLGFNHFRGGRGKDYQFIRRLRESLMGTMQVIFQERLKNLIVPTIKRELKRKWKNVLK